MANNRIMTRYSEKKMIAAGVTVTVTVNQRMKSAVVREEKKKHEMKLPTPKRHARNRLHQCCLFQE